MTSGVKIEYIQWATALQKFPTFYLYKLFTIVSKSFTLLRKVRILSSMVHASLATLLFLSEPKSRRLELWNYLKSQLILRYIVYYCQGCKRGVYETGCNYALLPCWEVIRWFILSSVYQVFIVEYQFILCIIYSCREFSSML